MTEKDPFGPPLPDLPQETIGKLVRTFYARASEDPVLGPIFAERLAGHWEEHFDKLTDFWTTIAHRKPLYNGRPFPAHMGLGLEGEHFDRWLGLFEQAVADVLPPDAQPFFVDKARRIAQSFRLGLGLDDRPWRG
jgi:hemoglobin